MTAIDQEHASRRRPDRHSLHSASVHISSLTEAVSNPQPWQGREEGRKPASSEVLSQDYLSPIKLVQLTTEPDLSRVSYLELTIDTTENSVGNFGRSGWLACCATVNEISYRCTLAQLGRAAVH